MQYYLYAITDCPGAPLPDVTGLGAAPLTEIIYDTLAAVVASCPPDAALDLVATEARLWQHEHVLEALMSTRTVLPARFGTVLASAQAAQTVLAQHGAQFAANLARVRDHVEVSVRVLWDEAPPELAVPTDAGGRAYMLAKVALEQARAAQRERAAAVAATLHAAVERLTTDYTHRLMTTPRMPLTAAYLVPRAQLAAFQETVAALFANEPTRQVLCTGPWPPYHFVAPLPQGMES
jgi:hypothetical protein